MNRVKIIIYTLTITDRGIDLSTIGSLPALGVDKTSIEIRVINVHQYTLGTYNLLIYFEGVINVHRSSED